DPEDAVQLVTSEGALPSPPPATVRGDVASNVGCDGVDDAGRLVHVEIAYPTCSGHEAQIALDGELGADCSTPRVGEGVYRAGCSVLVSFPFSLCGHIAAFDLLSPSPEAGTLTIGGLGGWALSCTDGKKR